MSRTERLARLLTVTHLDRLARCSWRGLLVLNYHRLGSPSDRDDPDLFSATLDDLDRHVALLAGRFDVVAAGTVATDDRRPARRIALTFDDGYRDQFGALDVLRSHGVPASFFISTGFLDQPSVPWWDELAWLAAGIREDLAPTQWLPEGLRVTDQDATAVRRAVNAAYKRRAGDRGEDFLQWLAGQSTRPRLTSTDAERTWMTWDMVRELRRSGMEVGGHTVTHPVLATLDEDGQRREVAVSVRRLAAEVDAPVTTFAYPVGSPASFDDRTRRVLREAGVERAFSFYGGVNRPAVGDPFNVLRAGVFSTDSPAVVQATAALPTVLAAQRRYS